MSRQDLDGADAQPAGGPSDPSPAVSAIGAHRAYGFTHGPWVLAIDHHQTEVRAGDVRGMRIASTFMSVAPGAIARQEANARLISAAPDFAEVAPDAADLLEQYAEYIRTVRADDLERHPYLPLVEDAARGLRAAIRKSTGEA